MNYAEYTRQEILEDLIVYEKRNQVLLKKIEAIKKHLQDSKRSSDSSLTITLDILKILERSEVKEKSDP